jgi:hypothetical protein
VWINKEGRKPGSKEAWKKGSFHSFNFGTAGQPHAQPTTTKQKVTDVNRFILGNFNNVIELYGVNVQCLEN